MLALVNGTDVANNPGDVPPVPGADPADPPQWYGVDIYDNMIVNNHAGWTGAGIAMQDAVSANHKQYYCA